MKWLPREKRNPFIIVVLVTAAVLATICFGLIRSQNATLASVADSRKNAGAKLLSMQTTVKNAGLTAKELEDVTFALSRAEGDMASGDLYSWTYGTMRLFKQQYKVEIPEIGHPEVGDVDLLPSFPYKQIRFTINGKAYYHDLGKFVADFENAFPHARVVNLVIAPAADTEQLSFSMEIIALVKPNAS
ncbi:MAG TPA: hypothetical protein VMJ12_10485 [Candidatus Acidoferrales bacterium]|nr:hypothetical protein [Candidatus Acidoferrales bacterium]